MYPQAQAKQEPGLQAGEGWFDVCSEGSRPAGPRSSQDLRHSEFSAGLGEAMYSAIAQALAFLCAVAPQASIPDIAAPSAQIAKTLSTSFCTGASIALATRGCSWLLLCSVWRMNTGQF